MAFSAESEGGMPQLKPESFSSQVFWLVFLFAILFLIIHFYFLPRLTEIRGKREKTINDYIAEAKKINASIEDINNKINNDLNAAKDDFDQATKKTYNDNKKKYEEKMKLINEGFENKKLKLTQEYFDAKNKTIQNIQKYSISLSDSIYEIIMKRKVKGSVSEFKKFTGEKN